MKHAYTHVNVFMNTSTQISLQLNQHSLIVTVLFNLKSLTCMKKRLVHVHLKQCISSPRLGDLVVWVTPARSDCPCDHCVSDASVPARRPGGLSRSDQRSSSLCSPGHMDQLKGGTIEKVKTSTISYSGNHDFFR